MTRFTISPFLLLLCAFLLLLCACDAPPQSPNSTGPGRGNQATPVAGEAGVTSPDGTTATPRPPAPPLAETFDGEPQLSIFPRVGEVRPDPADGQQAGIWAAYIDHLLRTSAIVPEAEGSKDRALTFKGFQGVESLGFFAPLAVTPATRYTISFDCRGDLAEGVKAGIGVLEYREFLWIGEQFTRSENEKYLVGRQEGAQVQSSKAMQQYQFSFLTGPETRMIHLVLYLDGANGKNQVFFDDIEVEPAS
ncbi:hypothetical protein JCM30471_17390 [Desulfuromonas carbonis]|uniref:hypothetical protein n=1 Tax=Desulfuromonas sp. DDH964 TaxID=1823759 RepID=UPI00078B28E1|nr:hypothetical protein [Desulfuromonas sp. DDH964]AMV73336.1 hypothetical protein DBW_3028 [Desulfuromonas sp. DDH964]